VTHRWELHSKQCPITCGGQTRPTPLIALQA